MNMNARVTKPRTRNFRLNLSKAVLEKLDAVVREGAGMCIFQNAPDPAGYANSSVQDRQACVDKNMQRVKIYLPRVKIYLPRVKIELQRVKSLLGLRRQYILVTVKPTISLRRLKRRGT